MMSNWPPLVAMSVVTRWRSTFSSSTTQLILLPVAASHFGASFCMMIMSALLTVAMVNSSACTSAVAPKQRTRERGDESGLEHLGQPPFLVTLSVCSVDERKSHR